MSDRHLTLSALHALASGLNGDPFAVLGPHLVTTAAGRRRVVRAFQPHARHLELLAAASRNGDGPEPVPMPMRHLPGLFEVELPVSFDLSDYRFRATFDHAVVEIADPYRFGPVLGDVDRHLLGEGTHQRAYRRLGAHPCVHEGVAGTSFAVWAPNALRVSVVGDFNGWDGRLHPMRFHPMIGVWEIFLPGNHVGQRYKFELRSTLGGPPFLKADPYGFHFETPPETASVVWGLRDYAWTDEAWMRARAGRDGGLDRPMSIYEVHLGSWQRGEGGRWLTYRELAARLVPYVKDLGFTHIELLPVMEHPFYGSWGYQVIGFFAPTSRYGTPEDFKWFVDQCHQQGIGVLLDWVPGHFPKDGHGLGRFDGTALYEHEDPRQGEHQDWGTLVFNYGRNEVRNFLWSNALFWLDEFHLDGLRVDAVASILYLDYSRRDGEWVPNRYGGRENLDAIDFLRSLNALTHELCPGTITIAEESTSWPGVSRPTYLGGLGFTCKWNMGWMHDILKYLGTDPVFRKWQHDELTFSMLYAYSENFILPFSHDEVVYGKRSLVDKMPGDVWQRFANLRALYGFMFTHPGKKLLFMGGEIGQWREWNHDDSLSWELVDQRLHAGLFRLVRELNHLYRRERALWELDSDARGFRWIDCHDREHSVVSFLRTSRDGTSHLVVVLNLTPVPRHGYRIGVPDAGGYRELFNSDAEMFGGSNLGNGGRVEAEGVGHHGYAQSLSLTLPPLSVLVFKPEVEVEAEQASGRSR
jgi:1,4-alpha-glucan branching enzyme